MIVKPLNIVGQVCELDSYTVTPKRADHVSVAISADLQMKLPESTMVTNLQNRACRG